MDNKDPQIFFTKKAISHEIYYTLYLQGGETDYHVHRKSTRMSRDILVFLIAHMCALYINGIA